jgi:4-oxalomesaconate tautomerase
MSQSAIRCSVIRGGTSKGLYFHVEDLPADRETRDAVLLAAMGSPDPREIDGMGGAHPLTSKVAVVAKSVRENADVDYLFLQVWPDRAEVSDNQNCGNLLAGVGPFALEEGLIEAAGDVTPVRIWMENTQTLAVAHVQTPGGKVRYDGTAAIDGVPGTHAPIPIDFLDVAGSTCGALLPTGQAVDEVNGIRVTCIDNGMPVVCIKADDLGLSGHESPSDIEANGDVLRRIGGAVDTRTLIPHRVHEAIGVFGAVSVATACLVPGSVAAEVAKINDPAQVEVEHPTGFFTVTMDVEIVDGAVVVKQAALLRTARLLMRGEVFVPSSVWSGR